MIRQSAASVHCTHELMWHGVGAEVGSINLGREYILAFA